MITKQFTEPPPTKDPRRAAGHKAESQMAFYLHRAFADDQDLCVLNNLRIVDEAATEHNGLPKTCQIDHLIIHRWGMFIIESKSVKHYFEIRDDGSGGDEWIRNSDRREPIGIQSPIQQARLQAEVLRKFLQRHREQLLGKVSFGFRTLSKLAGGTDQRGFKNMPIQVIVAISDQGNIKRIGKWREPEGPFGTFVCKADLVADKVRKEFNTHKSSAALHTKDIGDYGRWSMQHDEALSVARFLAEQHQPSDREQGPPVQPAVVSRTAPVATATTPPQPHLPEPTTPDPQPVKPACKSCGGSSLTANWGRFGYYWHCLDCDTNTPMPKRCPTCAKSEANGRPNKVRKEGPKYFYLCHACQSEQLVWQEPVS